MPSNRVSAGLGVGVAALIILSSLTAIGFVGAAETYEVHDSHELADSDAIETYEQDGLVRTNLTAPRMTVTIAEHGAACGVTESFVADTRNDYLCLHYRSDLPQRTELDIPAAYWHPYIRQDKASLVDGPDATFRPAPDDNATRVTVRFEGAAKVVYPIPEDVTASYALIEKSNDKAKRVLGVELWRSGTEWETINRSTLAAHGQVRIHATPDRTLLQYDASGPDENATWLTVPEDASASAPVYRTTRAGENRTVYLRAETSTAPRVRYRAKGSGLGRVDDWVSELTQVEEQLRQDLNALVPDGLFPGEVGGW